MLRHRNQQGSFYDAEHVCERLIPPDSFYRKFRETVWPLIEDELFEPMYCGDNGRPAIPPSLLAMAVILQFYKNLSDREMERACMYDIEVKYALGLRLDERPFDHSSLGDFRKRLLGNGKEKEVFDRILGHLVEAKLIEKNEMQRIDATHVIADIAVPNAVCLVKKGVYEILKPLKKRHKETLQEIEREINITEYTREKVNKDIEGILDMEKKRKMLVEVVDEARKVLRHAETIEGDKILTRRVEMLKRILHENIDEDEVGNGKEKDRKDKPTNRLVSPVDPDARHGAKSKTKKFIGYKANVTETVESRFITNIKAMPGNQPDGKTMVKTVMEQKQIGIVPSTVIGDTAYTDGIYRKKLRLHGTGVVAPLREVNTRTRAIYPKSMFLHDEEKQQLTCPAGVTTKKSYMDWQKGIIMYHFPMSQCNQCPRQKECTNERNGRRTVGISFVNKEIREAEAFNKTEEFKKVMKLRSPIEGKLSELVRYHGLRRARYRGLKKVGLQFYFTAAAVNLKRWFKILLEKMKPKLQEAAVA